MQFSISTRHGTLSESTQNKLKSKTDKLSRYFERLTSIELIVDLEDQQSPEVDLKVSAEHKHDFVAHGESENLLGALDVALNKIEQQLRKYKKKVQQRHRSHDARHQEPIAGSDDDEE